MSENERHNEEKQPPWEDAHQDPEQAFGSWLRQQREVREVALDEVAETTKIGRRYLEALEEGRFELLPAPVFTRGFLREYARYVGLNPDEVVNSYLTAVGVVGRESTHHESSESRSGRRLALTATLIGLAAASLTVWWLVRDDRQAPERATPSQGPSPSAEAASPVDVPLEAGESAPVPDAPLELTLDFSGRCWVEAVVDGTPSISQEHVQGESLRVTANERVVLSLSNPTAVQVYVNGEPRRHPPGPDGEVAGWEIVAPQATTPPPEPLEP